MYGTRCLALPWLPPEAPCSDADRPAGGEAPQERLKREPETRRSGSEGGQIRDQIRATVGLLSSHPSGFFSISLYQRFLAEFTPKSAPPLREKLWWLKAENRAGRVPRPG